MTDENLSTTPPVPPPRTHRFLVDSSRPPDRSLVREIALQLANYYAKEEDLSRNQWSKRPKATCRWQLCNSGGPLGPHVVAAEHASSPFHVEDFIRDLTRNRCFSPKDHNLPDPMPRWLDTSSTMSPNFHTILSDTGRPATFRFHTNLGPRFPMAPTIDREGTVYTSFQGILIAGLSRLFTRVLESSTLNDTELWLYEFRALVTETVALVDHTLHQLYYKAEFDPLPGWRFDAAALGERHGRRLMDKLKWVFQITRRELHAKDEIAALARVKSVRNHLQHFDPPAFACSMEEAAAWMNDVLLVSQLLWRIRMLASAMPNVQLIAMMLRPRVEFAPHDRTRKRMPPAPFLNYSSTSEEALNYAKTHGAVPEPPYEHVLIRLTREENLL